ncbi:MAG: hypothetical protein K6G69_00130 [Lachnospiraceae bacterium]|nr:hypothetical protein [Lachnospiraceae bacterium]
MNEELSMWIKRVCELAGEDSEFRNAFLNKLEASEQIKNEMIYFMHNNTFLGQYSVAGMTVVDIMIWQTDHFKSDLDRGLYDMQSNPNKMLIRAFDTMLDMEKDPETYIQKYSTDTGTDYPGKY